MGWDMVAGCLDGWSWGMVSMFLNLISMNAGSGWRMGGREEGEGRGGCI